MAGAGFKTFTAGEVLTASDVNSYLQEQAVMNFAGTAARASALPSPSEGMVTHIGGGTVEVYTGADWQSITAGAVAGDNLLYNGAMQVAQRGTSVTGITAGVNYTADRWQFQPTTMGTWTNTIESDGPSGSGFAQSWKVLCTTADAAPASGDFVQFLQRLEGQDLQRIAKGTASAKQLTLSFWVKSNVTGTYVANLVDSDNTRQVGAQYSINSSGTWEKKTITFPADATGALNNDNAESMLVRWFLGAGSDRTSGTLRTSWTSITAADLAVGQTNLAAATNNYWQITGVQLEVGNAATPFEFKSYGQELAECQRYYWRLDCSAANAYSYLTGGVPASSTTTAYWPIANPVEMRAGTSSITVGANVAVSDAVTRYKGGTWTIESSTTRTTVVKYVHGSGSLTQYRPYMLQADNDTAAGIQFSAEL